MHQMQEHQRPGEVRVVDLHQMVTEGHRESLKGHLNAVVDLSKRIGSKMVVDIIMDMIIIIIGDHHVVVGITIIMREERMPLNLLVVIIKEVVIGAEEEAPIITTGEVTTTTEVGVTTIEVEVVTEATMMTSMPVIVTIINKGLDNTDVLD